MNELNFDFDDYRKIEAFGNEIAYFESNYDIEQGFHLMPDLYVYWDYFIDYDNGFLEV